MYVNCSICFADKPNENKVMNRFFKATIQAAILKMEI